MDDFTKIGIVGIVLLTVGITKLIMSVTHDGFDKKRFAPLVSLASGILASALWEGLMPDTGWVDAIIRGVVIGLIGSGGVDHLKAFRSMRNNNGE